MELIQIRKKVNDIIKQYGTRDPVKIADYLCIRLSNSDSLKELLGFFYQDEHFRVICCSDTLSEKEKRSYIANALGHYFLYKEDESFLSFTEETLNSDNQKEKYANIFAATLLISDEEIINSIYDGIKSTKEISGRLAVDEELVKIKKELVNKED